MSTALIPLLSGEVHLWHAYPDRIGPADAYLELLTAEERADNDRFSFAEGRQRHLITRALIRTTLSRYAEVRPADWRFVKNRYGKPDIATPASLLPLPGAASGQRLRFNLSHCDSLISCAITLGSEIGVDVEELHRRSSFMDIARHSFSEAEFRTLSAQPEEFRRARFFHYWTLKEAYIKARGMGLSLGLDKFTFHPEAWWSAPATGRITVEFDAEILDSASEWQFALLNPSPDHQLGLAVRRGTERDFQIIERTVIP